MLGGVRGAKKCFCMGRLGGENCMLGVITSTAVAMYVCVCVLALLTDTSEDTGLLLHTLYTSLVKDTPTFCRYNVDIRNVPK